MKPQFLDILDQYGHIILKVLSLRKRKKKIKTFLTFYIIDVKEVISQKNFKMHSKVNYVT